MKFSINMLFVFVGTERTFWADISVPSRQGVSSDGDMDLWLYSFTDLYPSTFFLLCNNSESLSDDFVDYSNNSRLS